MSAAADFPGPIEITRSFRPRPNLRHAILDWDGTISLIRAGWVEVMVDVGMEDEPDMDRAMLRREMLALNGQPCIHQMIRMVKLVGKATDSRRRAEQYQRLYCERLAELVENRSRALRLGAPPAEHMVPGVGAFLGGLAEREIDVSVITGTPQEEVEVEAVVLGLGARLKKKIHGPRSLADREFTKHTAIHALVHQHRLRREELLAVGDGPVEVQEAKALGGLVIGVASDETTPGSRKFDEYKLRQLRDCGADIIVPDYLDAAALLKLVLGE